LDQGPLVGRVPERRHARRQQEYGIISVLPGPRPGHHMMILTGAGSELMRALAESGADPARVKEIMSHVLLPSGDCPAMFQVVVEAGFESNMPIGIRYVTHHTSHDK
jgi:hypothetical protein